MKGNGWKELINAIVEKRIFPNQYLTILNKGIGGVIPEYWMMISQHGKDYYIFVSGKGVKLEDIKEWEVTPTNNAIKIPKIKFEHYNDFINKHRDIIKQEVDQSKDDDFKHVKKCLNNLTDK